MDSQDETMMTFTRLEAALHMIAPQDFKELRSAMEQQETMQLQRQYNEALTAIMTHAQTLAEAFNGEGLAWSRRARDRQTGVISHDEEAATARETARHRVESQGPEWWDQLVALVAGVAQAQVFQELLRVEDLEIDDGKRLRA
jgi:hypothetical protein